MRHAELSRCLSDRARPPPGRSCLAQFLLFGLLAAAPAAAQEAFKPHTVTIAGPYSFSDELGGFTIRSVTGTGLKDDPIVLVEEIDSATPVTLVIRAVKPIRPFDQTGDFANGFLHMRIVVQNNSRLPWIEFEFELQERLRFPSVFGDGLSFDQRRGDSENIASTAFAGFSRDFEPFDRLLFRDGKIDHLMVGQFGFLITDFTPRWEFYLVQDPRIPAS